MPEVSILTATYNNGKYIEEAIESVLSQTFSDWELIIVDDGSTDDTKKKIDPYLDDLRITYVWQKNQGQSVARNTAYQQSKGKYIAILDSDDYWAPTKLEKQVKCLKTHPNIGLVYTNKLSVNDKSIVIINNPETIDISANPLMALLMRANPITHSSVLYNRKFLDLGKLQEESIRYADEAITLYRVALRAKEFKVIPEPLTFHRIHITALHFTEKVEDYKQGRLQTLDLFFKEPELPKQVLMLKRRAYAMAFYSAAFRYNERCINHTKALWNIFISFIYDPTISRILIKQLLKTIYLILPLTKTPI